MSEKQQHKWDRKLPPPKIAEHSVVKHKLLRQYLSRYIKTLTRNPKTEQLKLTLIDGFAGGGVYVNDKTSEIHKGSPLILLETIEQERTLIKASRQKEFNLDVDFVFVEKNKKAYEYLEAEIKQSPWKNLIGDKIHLFRDDFIIHNNEIIEFIKKKSKKTQYSIFVLDQCGYTQVPLVEIRKILSSLSNAEVILTFATDFLIDYLADTEITEKILAKLDITIPNIKSKSDITANQWRRAIQMQLRNQIPQKVNADYFTPFFIRSEDSHRDLWLMHLSKHHKARDVMTEIHWEHSNGFTHYAGTGLDMLGYEPNSKFAKNQLILPKFCFDETALESSKATLYEQIPIKLAELGEITCDQFFSRIVNGTPATFAQIKSVLQTLASEKIINLKDSETHKLTTRLPKSNDVISLSRQTRMIFGE